MKVAIASGKGGTGKTTIATNLALLLSRQHDTVSYIDCDVEEPNGHLFFKPEITKQIAATISVPVIDELRCTACGECTQFCQFKALVRLGKIVMIFPELCHGCGGCTRLCAQQAISEVDREIGIVRIGLKERLTFIDGCLHIGEAMSPPLIRKVLHQANDAGISVIDAPPGTSCPVITTVRETDFLVLVTEPTPFGLNDLALAIAMAKELAVPCGVVVNRADEGIDDVERFCKEKEIAVIARIPDLREVAEAYSQGKMALNAVPTMEKIYQQLWDAISERVKI
jgi:MinD superfamily P-loop ATPase